MRFVADVVDGVSTEENVEIELREEEKDVRGNERAKIFGEC